MTRKPFPAKANEASCASRAPSDRLRPWDLDCPKAHGGCASRRREQGNMLVGQALLLLVLEPLVHCASPISHAGLIALHISAASPTRHLICRFENELFSFLPVPMPFQRPGTGSTCMCRCNRCVLEDLNFESSPAACPHQLPIIRQQAAVSAYKPWRNPLNHHCDAAPIR